MPHTPCTPILESPITGPPVYPQAVYMQPFPHKQKMGLSMCPVGELIEFDSEYHAEMEVRRKAIQQTPDEVIYHKPPPPYDDLVDLTKLADANRELLELVIDYLAKKWPSTFRWKTVDGKMMFANELTGDNWDLSTGGNDWDRPFYVLGLLTQADWVIVMEGKETCSPEDGGVEEYRFVSAVNIFSFPGFLQRDRIGRLLSFVHHPVPKYDASLRKNMNKFFASGVREGRPVNRFNWVITGDPRMYRKDYVGANDFTSLKSEMRANESIATKETIADRVFYRTERQTLMRLPRTGAVAFEIKSTMHPLREALRIEGPKFALALKRALKGLEDPVKHYKGLSPELFDLVVQYLDDVIQSFGGAVLEEQLKSFATAAE
ncbi:hypothetical protein M427DRAFT_270691 [Gonapodya prolifera JEL478]|uniref:DUF3445 domain-containing protein n=1 Tax=Gonapodya prolifera (strain JEL478) TaxID=1344416 RepID=A0A139AXK9_GONPJ|nr:hypothetical protein M427DRAFT_270691 [Gonapodya prolifera JEL478]|eukprot:KXS21449.1 hypothetical protein M427DRAFT_270691 [Gonapodya prolifera JEL478]